MNSGKPRLTLYLVTDGRFITPGDKRGSLVDVVKMAIDGGVTAVQYREKEANTRVMVNEAEVLRRLCADQGVLFLVNDRIDVALAVDADGVHLGQDDMPAPIARKLLGPKRVIGVTVHNLDELKKAEDEGADYVSFAPVFATQTKPDHQRPLGVKGLSELVRHASVPCVAIGGINESNATDVFATGVDGICIVSAIMGADDPKEAARNLLKSVKTVRGFPST